MRWTVAGVPIVRQRELFWRLRIAPPARRSAQWVRGALRAHCAERFPDVGAP